MNVVLVGPETEENLGLRYLAASLMQAGHAVVIVPWNGGRQVAMACRRILREHPALVGLAMGTQRLFGDFAELAARLREEGYRGHITAGGHFAGLRAPDILADHPALDTILHHDAEIRIVQLVTWLQQGVPDPPAELDGLSWRPQSDRIAHRPAVKVADIDALPEPMRRKPDRILGIPSAAIVSSRGCAGSCSYCSIHAWHGRVKGARLRLRNPVRVAQEMIHLHHQRGVRIFRFHDDDFIHPNPARALARCRQILETAAQGIGKRFCFTIQCRPGDVKEELFRYLRERGLVCAYVGVENVGPTGIQTLQRRFSEEAVQEALRILRKLEVPAAFNMLLFHPDSDGPDVARNLRFLRAHCDMPFDVTKTELYAGSPLERRMREEGRAQGDYRRYTYELADEAVEQSYRSYVQSIGRPSARGEVLADKLRSRMIEMAILDWLHPGWVGASTRIGFQTLVREAGEAICAFLQDSLEPHSLASRRDLIARTLRTQRNLMRRNDALGFELAFRTRLARLGFPSKGTSPWVKRAATLAATLPWAALLLGSVGCDPAPHEAPKHLPYTAKVLFGTRCASCHGGKEPASGLDLSRPDTCLDQVVDVDSRQVPTMKRVQPSAPTKSYLVYKIIGNQAEVGGSGARMPTVPLSDEEIRDIQQWIAEGASKN